MGKSLLTDVLLWGLGLRPTGYILFTQNATSIASLSSSYPLTPSIGSGRRIARAECPVQILLSKEHKYNQVLSCE